MFAALRHFLTSKSSSRNEALASLRLLFVLAFWAQLLVAALVGAVLLLLVDPEPGGSSLLAQVLVALAVLGLPLVLLVAQLASRAGGKGGAMAGAIALGVLLSTPGWFLMLAMLAGSGALYLFILLAVLMFYYALGFVLAGRFARLVGDA